MVYAEAVAEHALKALAYLHGERYLGQQIEHLLPALDGLADEMYVDFGLAARRYAVKQHHVFFQKAENYVVVGCLLSLVERLYQLWMRLSGIVQPAYLALVGVQEFSYDKISEHCRSAVCLVHKLVAAHLDHGFGTCVAAYGVPMREREECLKHLKLGRSTLQHVESHTYGALAVIFGRKRHIGLGLCRVSVLALESRRQGSIHHVANRRQIVVGHPSPQF